MNKKHYIATQKQINLLNNRVRVWFTPSAPDCYTVAIKYQRNKQQVWDVYGISHNPDSPQGFNQYSHTHQGSYQLTTNAVTRKRQWPTIGIEVIGAILTHV